MVVSYLRYTVNPMISSDPMTFWTDRTLLKVSVLLCLAAAFSLLGFSIGEKYFVQDPIRTTYEAVLLDNGAAYFGRVKKITSDSLELADVYYVETRKIGEAQQISNVLIKRGKEWHSPDRMIISRSHVIFREPVAPDSKVARLIAGS